jgi:uncharacterized protein YndB with AHSA1/START domain
MWEVEHATQTSASREQVWRAWADVEQWPTWNGDIKEISLDGDFAPGSTIRMVLNSGDQVDLRIVEAAEPDHFVDEAIVEGATVRTTHRVEDGGERRRVSYKTEINAADVAFAAALGEAITGDFPETLRELVARLEVGPR